MIKLIRRGRAKEKQMECPYCHSLFSFEMEDVEKKKTYWKFGYDLICETERDVIQCPACKDNIVFESNPLLKEN